MLRAVLLLLAALPAARASPARPRGSRHLHELEASGHGIDSGRRLHAATPCENSIEPLLSGLHVKDEDEVVSSGKEYCARIGAKTFGDLRYSYENRLVPLAGEDFAVSLASALRVSTDGMEILTRVQVAKLIHRIRKELAKLPDEI